MTALERYLGKPAGFLHTWAHDNPGEVERLKAYEHGARPRPSMKTAAGLKLMNLLADERFTAPLLAEIRQILQPPPVPPSPAPPPVKPVVPPLLQGKTLFVAWGLFNNSFSEGQLADFARRNGYARVCLQIDFVPPTPVEGNPEVNLKRAEPLAIECRDLGFGVWQTAPSFPLGIPFVPDFYIGEVESPSDCQTLLDGPTPVIPHAILTSFTGLDADKAAALRALGYLCMVEADLPGNPNATPLRVAARASQTFGWPKEQVAPVLYLNGGKTIADYGDLSAWKGWGEYCAEYLGVNG